MVLSLITPLGNNFLKDFPGQNAVNLDSLDAYAGPCLTTHPLTPYTPQLKAVTTDPVLGTGGIIRGFYYRIFDQIYTWGEFRFGTAAINIGSGIYSVTLPFEVSSIVTPNLIIGRAPTLGTAQIWDESLSSGRQGAIVSLRTSTEIQFGIRMDSGMARSEVAHTIPIPWAVNDGVIWSARYKRVP
jgi:hypothetical protein